MHSRALGGGQERGRLLEGQALAGRPACPLGVSTSVATLRPPDPGPRRAVSSASARCGPWPLRRLSSAAPSWSAHGAHPRPSARAVSWHRSLPGSAPGHSRSSSSSWLTVPLALPAANLPQRAGPYSSDSSGPRFELVVQLLQPVLDDGLGLAETLRRMRFPSGPNPRLTTPRHRPSQCRCRSVSRHGASGHVRRRPRPRPSHVVRS